MATSASLDDRLLLLRPSSSSSSSFSSTWSLAEVHVPHGSELIIHSSADGRVEEKRSGSDPVQTNIFIFCHSQPEPLS
ncbi:hypothetical protein Q8A67_017069 [Cirrhinus molitorella]|uniref:Uncharacterized protein n=1 Tax=Cirrhinus molitorella TaxID=172907 RepID=A0AA88TFC5_9TELE|nr:hypothetical protein Q8A67_017069 [Cirrhinus molitorella]